MSFQFAYNVNGSNSNPPVAVTWPLAGTGAYQVGDLLIMDTSAASGYMGTVAAGNPGTVAAVNAAYRASGTAGQPGTVYLIDPSQIWKCTTDNTTYAIKPGAGSVQMLNAGTINSTPGTTTNCTLYAQAILPGDTNVTAYVRFPNTTF